MKTPNRDLLVLVKDEFMNERFMEKELEQLNDLLFQFETMEKFCIAHEVFDMNRNKKIYQARKIEQIARQKTLKPFLFFLNKN